MFHNETGTYVEAPDEIAKMLEVSDIDSVWTPATSWSAAATVEYVKKWGDRIDHVHIKTADLPRFQQIVDEGSANQRDLGARGLPEAR